VAGSVTCQLWPPFRETAMPSLVAMTTTLPAAAASDLGVPSAGTAGRCCHVCPPSDDAYSVGAGPPAGGLAGVLVVAPVQSRNSSPEPAAIRAPDGCPPACAAPGAQRAGPAVVQAALLRFPLIT